MEIRTFTGRDMNEALSALRATLGSDALILETRRVAIGNGAGIEITAMPDEGKKGDKAARETREPLTKSMSLPRTARSVRKVEDPKDQRQFTPPPLRETTPPLVDSTGELRELRREISELKSLFRLVAPTLGRGTVIEELSIQGISPELIIRLTQEAQADGGVLNREQVRQVLAHMIKTGGDVESRGPRRECVALLGPTGVGKTTTIVKLTTYLMRRSERRIGWISLDSHRIAGSEQLVVYAGVLGIPCEVVDSNNGLHHALERFSSCDLVLIDTAGVNPREDLELAELVDLLQDVPDLKCMLLLSATTNGRDIQDWISRYDRIGFDSLVFTKLDESKHLGALVNTMFACRRPVSYITVGQGVTNSLELATSDALAHRLLP